MQVKTYTVYTFDELSDEQKQKAIEHYYDINVDYDWWEFYPEDCAIDLKEFDIYRGDIKIDFVESAQDTAKHIIANHGEKSGTYVTSADFLKRDTELAARFDALEDAYRAAEEKYTEDPKRGEKLDAIDEEQRDIEEQREQLATEYRTELAEDVLVLLRNEYDYLTGEEAIAETLRANEYEFTEDGRID